MSASLHVSAAIGFAAGAETYAAGRPEYPEAVEHWLREDLRLGPDRIVLDLGAGTGKFLPRLRATGARPIAVEPVPEMLRRLAADNSDVEAVAGSAESLPLVDESVDAIVCAQSFHWFATPNALGEIRRVLKRGGALGLIWNVRDESVDWVARITALIAPYEGDAPRFGSGGWREVFPAAGFSNLNERRFPHAHVGPPERVIVERTLSTSFIAALNEAERAKVAAGVREIIATSPDIAGRETVSFPYETRAYWCAKAVAGLGEAGLSRYPARRLGDTGLGEPGYNKEFRPGVRVVAGLGEAGLS